MIEKNEVEKNEKFLSLVLYFRISHRNSSRREIFPELANLIP